MVRFRYNFYLQSSKHAANYFVKQHREIVAFSLKHFLRLPQQKNMYNDSHKETRQALPINFGSRRHQHFSHAAS